MYVLLTLISVILLIYSDFEKVNIYPTGHRALGVNVTVFIGEDACHMSQECNTYVGPSVDSHTFVCPAGTIGRYVFAQRFTEFELTRARREPFRVLRICEAEVLGNFVANML